MEKGRVGGWSESGRGLLCISELVKKFITNRSPLSLMGGGWVLIELIPPRLVFMLNAYLTSSVAILDQALKCLGGGPVVRGFS